jgi:cell division protein FtsW (lipid II flippase)
LAAVGGFGVISAALRVLISSGGALSAIPLTGQPPPMLAYGSSAALAFGLYLGLALGSAPRQGAHRLRQTHQGASS